jgi:hypothetical protein
MRRLKLNPNRNRRWTVFVPVKRIGCVLAPLLIFSALMGGYMVLQGCEALWRAELLIHTRRGGRVLFTGGPARLAGLGLLITGPAFASLPLALVSQRPLQRVIQVTLGAGVTVFVLALCWLLF